MVSKHLIDLRDKMAGADIDALIIPSTDPHQSEYVPPFWQRRAFLSGFTGSAGDLVVTRNEAGLWTDSRYFLQAETQLTDTGIDLLKLGKPATPSITDWLLDRIPPGGRVGVDPHLYSYKLFQKQAKHLRTENIALIALEDNPIDAIWSNRPPLSSTPITVQPTGFAGEDAAQKLDRLRNKIKILGASSHIITPLDAVAWLFNIRGQDVPYNPVVIAYAVVDPEIAHIFVDLEKVTLDVEAHLDGLVRFHPYDDFDNHLKSYSKSDTPVLVDPETTSQWIMNTLGSKSPVVLKPSPVPLMKAEKNVVEIAGMKAAHVRDGVAMVRFLHWLERHLGDEPLTEITVADRLTAFRQEERHYVGPSFKTISAFGPHSAVVHYDVDDTSDVTLTPDTLFLLDSGAQYLDGTTDITRTLTLGPPSDEQRECFTRVLKGHLSLAGTSFPEGTAGSQLDTIARKALWDIGRNYGHGTGHGVGAYLNVHEGPQAISYYKGIGVPLKIGMVLSIEPGCYIAGEWGIRIENLAAVVRDEALSREDTPFLKFDTLTLCPIDRKLIDVKLLTAEERQQLNRYHQRVFETLAPLLPPDTKRWLRSATRRI